MAERKRVNLTVSPEQKQKWDRAVAESNKYDSLSDLIRRSVFKELSENDSADSGTQGQSVDHSPELEQITQQLSQIETAVIELEDRVSGIEKEVQSETQAVLWNAVFEALPKESGDNAPDGRSAEDIAEELDVDRERVSHTLADMETQTPTVEIAFRADNQQYWVRRE